MVYFVLPQHDPQTAFEGKLTISTSTLIKVMVKTSGASGDVVVGDPDVKKRRPRNAIPEVARKVMLFRRISELVPERGVATR